MKACFFLQRRFAYVGHEMAILLKEKYGIKEFCAYTTTRVSYNFLKNQTDVNYQPLILEEDVYAQFKNVELDVAFLESFAADYGIPNLWPYINIDRVLRYNLLVRAYPADDSQYTHEELMKLFQVTAKAVLEFLEREKPDFLFFSIVGNLSSYLLYEIARKKGIKTFITCDPRIGSMQTLSEAYDRHTFLEETLAYIKNNPNMPEVREAHTKAEQFLTKFQEKPFYYMEDSEAAFRFSQNVAKTSYHLRFLQFKNFIQSITWLFKTHYNYFINLNKDKNDYSTIKPWWELWDKIVRKYRVIRGYNDLYDQADPNEKYVYFTLHTEPENLFPFSAPFFTDQPWVITQLARSIPLDYKLYVKDHPQMQGLRPRSYLKKIKKLPNVKLIEPSSSSLKLVQDSQLVATVTGTSGWEAILLNKPTIVFGHVFYTHLPQVKVCQDITQLPYLVKEQLEHFNPSREMLIHFLAGLYLESASIDLSQIWDVEGGSNREKKKKSVEPLVDLLAKKLNLQKIA